MKRLISLVLALVMVLVVAAASAATIEVSGAFEGESYEAYKLLEYTSNTTVNPAAYSYYLLDADYQGALGTALKTAGFAFTKSADGTQWFVSNSAANNNELTDAAAIAKKLYETIDTWKNAALASATATGSAEGKVSFTDLPTGYWFVTSSLGSLCSLQSYDDQQLVVEKNTMIVDEKEVSDTEAQVGDILTYTITLTDGKGTNLAATVTDTMSAGLTYNDDAVITANGETLVKDTDYTVAKSGNTVVVYTFTADVMTALDDQEQIVITYTATVNSDASLDGTEVNTEFTEYSEQKTDGDKVEVKLSNLTILKTDGSAALKGAQFALYRTDATSVPAASHAAVKLRALTDAELTAANITKETDTVYYEADSSSTNTTIDMTDASKAVIYGLDKDSTYFIEETKAPDGFNKLAAETEVQLETQNSVTIVNNAGTELPSTGGIGTTIFYVVGGILLIGAAVVLVARRKASN